MKRFILAAAIAAIAILPAYADDDGGASGCVVIIVGSCSNIDVANGAITTDELANGAVTEGKLETNLKNKINGKADSTYVDSENATQDAASAATDTAQDVEIAKKANKTYVDQKNQQQNVAIGLNYLWDYQQQGQISDLQGTAAEHGARLDAHDALLSQQAQAIGAHGKKLEEHERGLAIAMAMPDAWLSDKKRFGVFGAFGGFEGETALGVAAIGRINDTWTLNLKGGADTGFKNFGWQLGAGAQW